ncbi:hypothetical protein AVEN_61241-1 [Araneus ventricosus]|uniref:Lipase domain-containing protein n=1 Tax=Araneus ventricosus TaxID=182803 RepID=A0A4Y2U5V9_ARAVE|nr:hypothetical protein AVEN_61241-1 [Araneus ventricosus]
MQLLSILVCFSTLVHASLSTPLLASKPKPVDLEFTCMEIVDPRNMDLKHDDVPLIFLHGLSGNKESWHGVFEIIALDTKKKAVEDADVLIIETAASVISQYDNIFVVGENIDFSVLLTGLAPMKEYLYFRKCEKGKTPDVLYSTASFKYKFSRMILFIHAFSGCDTTSAVFSHGKTKFCSLLEEIYTWKKKYKYFSTLKLPLTKWLRQAKLFLIIYIIYNPRTSACDLNHLHYTLFTQSATKVRSTLACLPPTVDAARFHALRSYLQTQKWLGHEKNPL